MASAAASNAGPRLAEVAGKASRNGPGLGDLFFSAIGVHRIRFLRRFQGSQNRVQLGVEHNGRPTQRLKSGAFSFPESASKQVAAVELHGEVGILQQVS